MSDRIVRKIGSDDSMPERDFRFSEFQNESNIVLLGEPGAGKTYLFSNAAAKSGGAYLTARDFLIKAPDSYGDVDCLFIDALDEKRSGRGDNSTIDQIARQIALTSVKKLRVACRAADWFGESDLSALKAALSTGADIQLLALQPLSQSEQQSLLVGLGANDSIGFIEAAIERGLETMLSNPQTLIMLYKQAGTKGFPATRTELFANAIDLLLSETNPEHSRRTATVISASKRLDAAGAACALRLISDVQGIGLRETCDEEELPSYCSVSLIPGDELLSALSSRLFVPDSSATSADYLHRTLAEFTAAKWLAGKIREGLPLGRVIALISHEGTPTTEQRGLHAWLAVHLPEYAEQLINQDPFGVMAYGDPASFMSSQRLYLIDALARLADRDPWFRASHWDAGVFGLGQRDLVPRFREILSAEDKNHSLRSIVLDAVAEGELALEMEETLADLILCNDAHASERITAVDAFLHVGDSGRATVLRLYPRISNSKVDLSIRFHVVECLYGSGIGADEVARLLTESLETNERVVIGTLWNLDSLVPDDDIAMVLESFSPPDTKLNEKMNGSSDVLRVVDILLCRAIEGRKECSATVLLSWLKKRSMVCQGCYGGDSGKRLRAALVANGQLYVSLAESYFASCVSRKTYWKALFEFRELMLGTIDFPIVLDVACAELEVADESTAPFYFGLALQVAIYMGPSASLSFTRLIEMERSPELEAVAENRLFCEIPDYRMADIDRKSDHEEKTLNSRKANQQDFDDNLGAIVTGQHIGWMGFVGEIYFSRFADTDPSFTPEQRLTAILGESRTALALMAVTRYALTGQIPETSDLLTLYTKSKYRRYWFGFLAGICEHQQSAGSLASVDPERLSAAILIDMCHPSDGRLKNFSSNSHQHWKDELKGTRPELVATAYEQLVRHQLAAGKDHISGMYELMCDKPLLAARHQLVMPLLKDYPTCVSSALERLLHAALVDAPTELANFIPLGQQAAIDENNDEAWAIWTAYGLVCELPNHFKSIGKPKGEKGKLLIWAMRNAIEQPRMTTQPVAREISPVTNEFVIKFVGSRIENSEYPEGGWSGDSNPWDAAKFLKTRVNNLSSSPTAESTDVLKRLAVDNSLISYREFILHACATQRRLRADTHYRGPSWSEVAEVLQGGRPANVADLQSLTMANILSIGGRIEGANTDPHKQFWNVDQYGRIDSPKPEEGCRDVLVEMLRSAFAPLSVHVDPEGHMASSKRADVCLSVDNMSLAIELKRDYHSDLWTAMEQQLIRFYTRDPKTQGYGIYGVFWFGNKRGRSIPTPPPGIVSPTTPEELREALVKIIPEGFTEKIRVFVLDVSGG